MSVADGVEVGGGRGGVWVGVGSNGPGVLTIRWWMGCGCRRGLEMGRGGGEK